MIRGEYDVRVFLLEEEIFGSPWKAMVTTGNPVPKKCTAEGLGLAGGNAGVMNSILIESNDHYGNVVTRCPSGHRFNISVYCPSTQNHLFPHLFPKPLVPSLVPKITCSYRGLTKLSTLHL